MSIYQVRNNTNRVTGLASGLDTDAVIKGMLQREQAKIYSVEAEKTLATWRQESYRSVLSKLNGFEGKYFDILSSNYILSPSKLQSVGVKYGSTAGNFEAGASANAVKGTYGLKINRIAKKALKTSDINMSFATAGNKYNFKKVIGGTNDDYSIGGNSIKLDSKEYDSLTAIRDEFNSKLTGATADIKAFIKDGSIGFDNKIEITDSNKEITVSLNGKDYNIEIPTGKFTTSEIGAKLNSALSGASASDGTKFADQGYKVDLTSDRLGLKLTKDGEPDINNVVKFTSSSTDVSTTVVAVSSSEASGTGANVTNFTISGGEISYENRIITGVNDALIIDVGGVETPITLDAKVYVGSESSQVAELVNDINSKLTTPNLSHLSVSVSSDNKLSFKSGSDKDVVLKGNAARGLGFYDGFKLSSSMGIKAEDLFSGRNKFSINDSEVEFDFSADADVGNVIGAKGKSLEEILDIVSDKANVNIRYSELSKKFVIESKESGVSQKIEANDITGGFISTLFGGDITMVHGEDAQVEITDPSGISNIVERSSNSFSIDGVSYDLKATNTVSESFTVSSNAEESFNIVKSFVEDYNELISDLNSKVDERRSYSFKPLNTEQKKDMKESEIEEWEKKARKGLLQNDNVITKMLTKIRTAFFDKVEGSNLDLKEIGITTSSDYTKKGKLEIDEEKLKKALSEKGEDVMELLIGKSTSVPNYSRSADQNSRETRYKESGIFHRINDIIQDNVSTYRDSFGRKGSLVEIAGVKGDITFNKNVISKRIEEKEKLIKELTRKMYTKQEGYYKKFARLETMMNKYNSQSNYFMSQMGG